MGLDHIEAEFFSPLGSIPLVWIDASRPDADAQAADLASSSQAIVGALDRDGQCPPVDPSSFDLLLTTRRQPPRPWAAVPDVDRAAQAIVVTMMRAPVASAVAAQVLRIGDALPFAAALQLESLAYSTLLGGAEFAAWRAAHPRRTEERAGGSFLQIDRVDDVVTIMLARPERRNAICAGMRDALHETLCAALDDPSLPKVVLLGNGACFSVGGDLDEFGTATDLAGAHAVRTLRSCAMRLHELGERATVVLHGACIGSGIEVAAAAARRLATAGTFVQLPETAMGLIPGAGGTVSLSRAIGRHRTCYMVLSGRRIPLGTAAAWGLVEAIGS